jgi:hypothetical protein
MKPYILLIALIIILGGVSIHQTIELETVSTHYQFTLELLHHFMSSPPEGVELREEIVQSHVGKFDV